MDQSPPRTLSPWRRGVRISEGSPEGSRGPMSSGREQEEESLAPPPREPAFVWKWCRRWHTAPLGPRAHLARGRSAQDEVHALRELRGCPGPLFPAGRSSPPRDTFPSQFRLHPPQPGGCPVRSCPWALLWALLRAPLVGDQICYCFFYWISPNWLQVLSREVLGAALPLPGEPADLGFWVSRVARVLSDTPLFWAHALGTAVLPGVRGLSSALYCLPGIVFGSLGASFQGEAVGGVYHLPRSP